MAEYANRIRLEDVKQIDEQREKLEGRFSEPSSFISSPPRSHLYHLKPIGIGEAEVESLTSFTARLVEAHCVPMRKMLVHIILPLYGKAYLPIRAEDNGVTAFWKDSYTLNGTSTSANEFVCVLEQLTLRDDLRFLTMLTWAEVLSCRYLLRQTKVWCPFCYQEWRENGMVVYEPLLWSLEIVTFCVRHNQPLWKCCPYCKRDATMLSAQVQLGYCSHCGTWLGLVQKAEYRQNKGLLNNELKWQRYVVQTVGEMLAASTPLSPSPDKEGFARSIAEYLEYLADGKVSVLARKLCVSRRTIRDWKQSIQTPQLESILQCCFILNISPMHLFVPSVSASSDALVKALPIEIEVKEKRKKRYRVLDTEKIRKELELELQFSEEPPQPMSVVAKRLKYDHSYLLRYFPELCRAISQRFALYRKKKREERKQRILEEIRQITRTSKKSSFKTGVHESSWSIGCVARDSSRIGTREYKIIEQFLLPNTGSIKLQKKLEA